VIVFSNTIPFLALSSTDHLALLPALFTTVHVAESVERDTLELALARQADLALIDERIGRNLAEYLGLRITGTLGVLLKARQQGFIASFRQEAEAMRRQGIHYHPALIDRLARVVGE
jgi:predicted nucleic acid-binding protein